MHECTFGVRRSRATATIALIGDSHASHWRAALEVVARANRWHGVSIARSGCPFTKAVKNLRVAAEREDCVAWNRAVLEWLHDHPEVGTVFVSQISGSRWIAPAGQSEFAAAVSGYSRAWRAAPRSVRRIVVIRDTPKADSSTAECVQRAIGRRRDTSRICTLQRDVALDADPAAVAAARLRSPRVKLVDLTRFMCDSRRCYAVVGGALVHKDAHHLTAVFATTLGPYLQRAVQRVVPEAATARECGLKPRSRS